MKVFVVTKSYDWGEEYGSGSENVKVFYSLNKAKEFCKDRNKTTPGGHGYEYD